MFNIGDRVRLFKSTAFPTLTGVEGTVERKGTIAGQPYSTVMWETKRSPTLAHYDKDLRFVKEPVDETEGMFV